MSVNVCIRADASAQIGSGHVVRCLTLADALRERGAHASFVSRDMPDPLIARIVAGGHELVSLPPAGPGDPAEDPVGDAQATLRVLRKRACDWLVVDHYGFERHWEEMVAPAACSILVVDDLANRAHVCDVLLDQNYYEDGDSRYSRILPSAARRLLGPTYALLRPQFPAARAALSPPADERLFVSVGGHDPFGLCEKVVGALRVISRSLNADIVTGADEALHARVKEAAIGLPGVKVHGFVDNMAALMATCTMAVGAGGSSTWERCALGLPSLVAIVADNQRQMVEDLARARVIATLGEAGRVTIPTLSQAIVDFFEDTSRRVAMRRAGLQLVDGLGAERVADVLQEVSWNTG
jgi:UDP-2,4-diacetamido-2,4,6-trideoxy-beta-L-altropyranose hydrolase